MLIFNRHGALTMHVEICLAKFSYFSMKTYDVGTQKNCLSETVLLITPK